MLAISTIRSSPIWRRQGLFLAAIAVVVSLNALLVWMLYESRQATRQTAIQSATNLVSALARDISRNIELYDLSLQEVQEGMRLPEIEGYNPKLRSLILFDRAASARHLGSIRVIGPEGSTISSSLPEGNDAAVVADQPFFRIHREDPHAGLFVSGPVRSPWTGSYGIILSRRLTRADGTFAGVVSGYIRLSFFRGLFADLRLGERSSIAMLRSDGTLVLRMPFREEDVGRDVRSAILFQHFPQRRAGSYEGVAQWDGERRIYVYTQIDELPLVLTVAVSVQAIYAAWWHEVIALAIGMIALDVTALGLLLGLMRELKQRTSAEAELAKANAELADLATLDPLTGLANRRVFVDMMRREWRRCARNGDPLSMLMLDVDNFKGFNDLYGHGCGDTCLQSVAAAIVSAIRRPGDLAVRYGGEEFVVILPATRLDGAVVVAEQIRNAVLRQKVPHKDAPTGFVSVSVGAACSTALADPSIEALIETADQALYEAKRGGRNRTAILPDQPAKPQSSDSALDRVAVS